MMNSHLCANADYFRRFVRNPRVSNEMITPYKGFFEKAVPEQEREAYLADPMKLVAWVAENIRVDKDCNLGGSPITPEGVWKARTADAHSRDIFFVSMARSMGIPARIDEVTGKVQLMGDEGAVDVNLRRWNRPVRLPASLLPDIRRSIFGRPEVLFSFLYFQTDSCRNLEIAEL